MNARLKSTKLFILMLCGILVWSTVWADDTDIYKPKVQHNVMILLDNSGSMAFGVYDDSVNYFDFYKYVGTTGAGWSYVREYETTSLISNGVIKNSPSFSTGMGKNRIYLIRANTGYVNGMTGDAGNPSVDWMLSDIFDTGTTLDADGNLSGGYLSTNSDGMIVFSETFSGYFQKGELPNGRSIQLHDWKQYYDGTRVDNGFAGMMRAPGFYFSGYQSAKYPEYSFFFAIGNYINLQMLYNLQVSSNGSDWTDAWQECSFPLNSTATTVNYALSSPNYPANYPNNNDSSNVIYQADAGQMRLYFSKLVLADNKDIVTLKDETGKVVKTYKGSYSDTDGLWTDWVTGKQITIRFQTGSSTTAAGWNITKYEYQPQSNLYKVATRLEIAKEAIIDVIESTRGKINWGVSVFDQKYNSGSVELAPLNASFNDDSDKQNLINQLEKAEASGGTPLGESLQDIFTYFSKKVNQVHRKCNKNFVITLTDGFPSVDGASLTRYWCDATKTTICGTATPDDWKRISGVDFNNSTNHDAVQFTVDPFQYHNAGSIPNYYDDVAYYMFSHSYVDGSLVAEADRRGSADNITVHNIGFCVDQPMLQHTADLQKDQNGTIGMNLTAFSKAQVISAFYSLGLAIAEYNSYTAPVVSVDETNRVQSGDRLYMALFKPKEGELWSGNLKKYGIRQASEINSSCTGADSRNWFVVDQHGEEATDCLGYMDPNTSSHWTTGLDGGDVERGGAGQVLYNSIPAPSTILSGTPTFRNIHTYLNGSDVVISTDTITNTDLGVTTDAERWAIINFIYGYTYAANADGSPVYKRSWPMGAIIHATPELIDYFDTTTNALTHRYIAVGANDGMLHIFNDADGKEVYAFVPPVVLTSLQKHDPALSNDKVYTVDGPLNLVKDSSNNLLLIFGLRRGGRAYYALDVTSTDPEKWSLKWSWDTTSTGMGELGQSWAKPEFFKVKWNKDTTTGKYTYKPLMLIPGGYDAGEDRSTNDDYYLTKTHTSTMGKAIYIIDLDTGALLADTYFSGGTQFSYDAADTGIKSSLKYCFPADPTVALAPDNTLLSAYLADLYGQVWKISYDSTTLPGKFNLNLIFQANPMTDQPSAYEMRTSFSSYSSGDSDPRPTISFIEGNKDETWVLNPRKTFYSPEVGWSGNCYTDAPVLYLGTGDRENPTFTGSSGNYVQNGLYAFYDAHNYYIVQNKQTSAYADLTQRFTEKDLLNVTCGALEPDVPLDSDSDKSAKLKSNISTFLEEGAKGWYIQFDDLGKCYGGDAIDSSHPGEKAISPVTLFNGVIYAPTYQPPLISTKTDDCDYNGTARIYALKYCNGNAAYDWYKGNNSTITKPDGTVETKEGYTRLDRFLGIGTQIPSGVAIVIRYGTAEGFISVEGKILNVPDLGFPSGLIPYYWQDTRENIN